MKHCLHEEQLSAEASTMVVEISKYSACSFGIIGSYYANETILSISPYPLLYVHTC